MTDDEYQPVTVSRRIRASAHDIFQVLADPGRHLEFDGSQSLRGAGSTAVISGVGDVFVMKMHYPHLGDYEMNNYVVEYEPDRRIGWEPAAGRGHPYADPDNPARARWGQRWSYQLRPDGPDATVVTEIYDCSRAPEAERAGMDDGKVWIDAMTKTLERLDALCARPASWPPFRALSNLTAAGDGWLVSCDHDQSLRVDFRAERRSDLRLDTMFVQEGRDPSGIDEHGVVVLVGPPPGAVRIGQECGDVADEPVGCGHREPGDDGPVGTHAGKAGRLGAWSAC